MRSTTPANLAAPLAVLAAFAAAIALAGCASTGERRAHAESIDRAKWNDKSQAAAPTPTPGEIVGWSERTKVEYVAVKSKTVGGPKLPPQGFRAIGKDASSTQVYLRYTALFGDFANLNNPPAMNWKGQLKNSEPEAQVDAGAVLVWGSWWGDWPWVRGRRLSGGGTVFASSSAGYQEILGEITGVEAPLAAQPMVIERMYLLTRMPKGTSFKVQFDPSNNPTPPGGAAPQPVLLTEPSYVDLIWDAAAKVYRFDTPVIEKDWPQNIRDTVARAKAAKVSYESATK